METNNLSGVTYFKLESPYSGDTTKYCGLYGEEVDKNFFFLRGYDIATFTNGESGNTLVLTRLNGERLEVEIPDVSGSFSGYVIENIERIDGDIAELSGRTQELEDKIEEGLDDVMCTINGFSGQVEYLFATTDDLKDRVGKLEAISADTRISDLEAFRGKNESKIDETYELRHDHRNKYELAKIEPGDVDKWNDMYKFACMFSAITAEMNTKITEMSNQVIELTNTVNELKENIREIIHDEMLTMIKGVDREISVESGDGNTITIGFDSDAIFG